jgi:hypothetical protein
MLGKIPCARATQLVKENLLVCTGLKLDWFLFGILLCIFTIFPGFLPRLFTYIALISLPTHASLSHRIKNIRRYNCTGQSRYAMRNDIFQNITVPDKKCRKRCYQFKHNITYSVIMVKEVVLSCRDSNRLPP